MDFAVYDFIEFLDEDITSDYGDFKREIDYQLHLLESSLRPLTPEQLWHLWKMREQLLWSYDFNIEEMKLKLREEAQHLEEKSEPEL